MIPLANEENKIQKTETNAKCKKCKIWFSTDDKNKKYHKVRDHCYYTAKYGRPPNDICNLR